MKSFIAAALILTSLSSVAEIMTCSGSKDGKNIVFSISKDASLEVESVSVSIDGVRVSQQLSEIRVSELAGGTMITAGVPNSIAINDVSIFTDAGRPCFDKGEGSCSLGWVSLYSQNLVLSGIDLICE